MNLVSSDWRQYQHRHHSLYAAALDVFFRLCATSWTVRVLHPSWNRSRGIQRHCILYIILFFNKSCQQSLNWRTRMLHVSHRCVTEPYVMLSAGDCFLVTCLKSATFVAVDQNGVSYDEIVTRCGIALIHSYFWPFAINDVVTEKTTDQLSVRQRDGWIDRQIDGQIEMSVTLGTSPTVASFGDAEMTGTA